MQIENRYSTVRKFICFLIGFFTGVFSFAGTPDTSTYFSGNALRYDDRVYVPNIHTVQLSSDPAILAAPIVRLGSDDKLYLSFDDLDGDYKSYYYTFVHCTSKWDASDLLVNEYLDGFAENPITSYKFSRTTLQRYTHYSAVLPGEDTKFLLSGNYLLKVYLDNDQAKLVLTRRLFVYEQKVTIDASVHAATIVADRNFKQEVDFNINYNVNEIFNPFAEIYPVLMQNGRWDNAVVGISPQFLKDGQLVYDYEDTNVFKGGNEFRWFDTRSIRSPNEHTGSVTRDSDNIYSVYLTPDERRTYKRYTIYNDIDGKFLIKTYDGSDNDVDADYCRVHFFLPWPMPATEGNIYIFGALSDWQCKPGFKMHYNDSLKGYEATLFLKQGYYNYEYVLLADNQKSADDFYVEGMHQETENEYTIFVYYRKQGSVVDQLIGLKQLNSHVQ